MKKLLVLFIVAMFVAPVMATADPQWDMYGSARMVLFSEDVDKDRSGLVDENGDAVSDSDTVFDLAANSRVGAKVKVSDELTGRWEIGIKGRSTLGGGLAYYSRLLYGTWNFGSGKLSVGQMYTPTHHAGFFGQVIDGDDGLTKAGVFYADRQPAIQLGFGGFKVALVHNAASTASANDNGENTDVTIPKIEFKYTFKTDTMAVGAFGGYQTFNAEVDPADADADPVVFGSDKTEGVTSYALGVDFKTTVGPVFIKAIVWTGQNMKNYGLKQWHNAAAGAGYNADGEVVDATSMGGGLSVGAKLSDKIKIDFGVATYANEIEDGGVKAEESVIGYYINLPITLAKGVYIVPEISIIDGGELKVTDEDAVKYGTRTAFGAKFQINF